METERQKPGPERDKTQKQTEGVLGAKVQILECELPGLNHPFTPGVSPLVSPTPSVWSFSWTASYLMGWGHLGRYKYIGKMGDGGMSRHQRNVDLVFDPSCTCLAPLLWPLEHNVSKKQARVSRNCFIGSIKAGVRPTLTDPIRHLCLQRFLSKSHKSACLPAQKEQDKPGNPRATTWG